MDRNDRHDYRLNLWEIARQSNFPYRLKAVGHSFNNVGVRNLAIRFPDQIEVCLRLSASGPRIGNPVQTVGRECYRDLSFPHVIVKPPNEQYSLTNFPCREVLYMIYPSEQKAALEAAGLFKPPYCWVLDATPEFNYMLKRFEDLSLDCLASGAADRLDLLAFQLICELILRKNDLRKAAGEEHELMQKIDSWICHNALGEVDFEAMARKFGLSRSTFFRYWKRYSQISPAKYLLELRLKEVCRKLVTTREPVSSIAGAVHLGDSAYLGLVFRQRYGVTPLHYRKRYSLDYTAGKGYLAAEILDQ